MAFPSIKIVIGADTGRLNKDLKKGEGLVNNFSRVAKGAMLGVAAAATTAAIKIGMDGVKAAIEDEAAAAKLAKTLENVTKATEAQTKAVEDYITKTTLATGVADDQLRPSLDRLVRSTKDVKKAQELQAIALDVSAGTGKDLMSVTQALAKAYDGNFGALKRMGVSVSDAVIKSKDFTKVAQALRTTFGGQMEQSLKTHAGQLRVLTTRWNETKESIGFVILDGLKPLMDWATSADGQKAINDGMKTLLDIVKGLAKEIPPIVKSFQTLVKLVSGNFDFSKDFMSTEMLAAAAAFVAMPGTPQMRGIAAVAAYAAAKGLMGAAPETVQAGAPTKAAKVAAQGGQDAILNYIGNNVYGGNSSTRKPFSSMYGQTVVNVTVNGATDPAATAKAVSRSLNKAQRMGINTNAIGAGS